MHHYQVVLRIQVVQLRDTLINIAHTEVLTMVALQQLIQDTYKVPLWNTNYCTTTERKLSILI